MQYSKNETISSEKNIRTSSNYKKSNLQKEYSLISTKADRALTFTKKIVLFILIISEFQILLSYVLAFLGKSDIAETLSSQVVITCIGTVIAYCLKALIENLSKYNDLFMKKNDSKDNQDNQDNIQIDFSNDINIDNSINNYNEDINSAIDSMQLDNPDV